MATLTFDSLFVSPVVHQDFPRCKHSVYDPDRSGRAGYCSICGPVPFKERNVKIPNRGDFIAPELRANKTRENECPSCHSRIYIELKNGRECADCGENYGRHE